MKWDLSPTHTPLPRLLGSEPKFAAAKLVSDPNNRKRGAPCGRVSKPATFLSAFLTLGVGAPVVASGVRLPFASQPNVLWRVYFPCFTRGQMWLPFSPQRGVKRGGGDKGGEYCASLEVKDGSASDHGDRGLKTLRGQLP